MGKLIVKDNALIEASHKLSEVEQRIILLAIVKARECYNSVESLKDQELLIDVADYVNMFNVGSKAAYRTIKKALLSLFNAKWGYRYINENNNLAERHERFVQSVEYIDKEGVIKLVFANALIPMLVELERRFTAYEIEQVSNLRSQYAMRLYEFFLRMLDKKAGKGWLDISVDDLRWRFNLSKTEYTRLDNFKRKVLDYSIKEINEHTDLNVSYTQKKDKQKIVGFRFEFTKKQVKKATKKQVKSIEFNGLNDKEREIVESATAYADEHCTTQQHKNNVIAKALRDYRNAEIQAQHKAEQEKADKQLKKALKHAQMLENQQVEQFKHDLREQQINAIVERFECLNSDEQAKLLDEVEQLLPQLFVSFFKVARQNNTAHTDKQFATFFEQVMAEL